MEIEEKNYSWGKAAEGKKPVKRHENRKRRVKVQRPEKVLWEE